MGPHSRAVQRSDEPADANEMGDEEATRWVSRQQLSNNHRHVAQRAVIVVLVDRGGDWEREAARRAGRLRQRPVNALSHSSVARDT